MRRIIDVFIIKAEKAKGFGPTDVSYENWMVRIKSHEREIEFFYRRPVHLAHLPITDEEVLDQIQWEAFLYESFPVYEDYRGRLCYEPDEEDLARDAYEYSRFCAMLVRVFCYPNPLFDEPEDTPCDISTNHPDDQSAQSDPFAPVP